MKTFLLMIHLSKNQPPLAKAGSYGTIRKLIAYEPYGGTLKGSLHGDGAWSCHPRHQMTFLPKHFDWMNLYRGRFPPDFFKRSRMFASAGPSFGSHQAISCLNLQKKNYTYHRSRDTYAYIPLKTVRFIGKPKENLF